MGSALSDVLEAGCSPIQRQGIRAITHAAFTPAWPAELLQNAQHTAPEVRYLDSPLLACREPDGSEEDLTGTDLKEQFYGYLKSLTEDRQIIVVENTDPPLAFKQRPQVMMFSKNPHAGRYGLFPLTAPTQPAEEDAPID